MLQHPIEVDASERSPAIAQAAMVEALVAGEGLERVAAIAEAHVGAPVGIFVPRPGSDGSGGTPAERFVAELVAGGDPERPTEVAELTPIVSRGELQGAVLMLGEGGPGGGEYLAAAAVAALTGIAMLNARDDTARGLGASLIGDLLGGRELQPGEVLRRARLLGRELGEGLVALCGDPGEGTPGRLVAAILAERPDAIAENLGGRVYALLPGAAEHSRRGTDGLTARGAHLSSHYEDAGSARLALEEAELLLEATAEVANPAAPTACFRLLFRLHATQPEVLRRFSEETIGPLLDHDERSDTELLATLRAYSANDCNMNLTARATYTHRHTVSNRLARVQQLTGLDPFRAEDRELLGLALKARRIVELRPG